MRPGMERANAQTDQWTAAARRPARSVVALFSIGVAAAWLASASAGCHVDDVLVRTCVTAKDCDARERCIYRGAAHGTCALPRDDAPLLAATSTPLSDARFPDDATPSRAPALPGDVVVPRFRARPLALPLSAATAASPSSSSASGPRFTLRPFFPRRSSP